MYLQEILSIIWKYQQYNHQIYGFSILYVLFKSYNFQQELITTSVNNLLDNIMVMFSESQTALTQLRPSADMLCRSMFTLQKIVTSKYSHLSSRNRDLQTTQIQNYSELQYRRIKIINTIINQLSICLQQFQQQNIGMLLQFIRYALLISFKIKIAIQSQGTNQKKINNQKIQHIDHIQLFQKLNQVILELLLTYTVQLKKIMVRTELWHNIVKWYQESYNKVTQSLLILPDNYQCPAEDSSYLTVLLYMIVQHTTLPPKQLKQQKFYHTTFTSLGSSYEPGSVINQKVNIICACLFHYNYQQVPVVVIEDRECFIIGMKVGLSGQQIKILINIKFKDIQSFVYGGSLQTQTSTAQLPKFIKINLRGMQQMVLQFSNPKIIGNLFKDYLIKSKDLTRQRQMSFLNQWIKDYQIDSQKSLEIVKQKLKKQDYIVI